MSRWPPNGAEGYFSPDTAYPILKHENVSWYRTQVIGAGLTELYWPAQSVDIGRASRELPTKR